MTDRKAAVLDAIDAANAIDPNLEDGHPEALLYGERMTAELDRLFPDASDVLAIAAVANMSNGGNWPGPNIPKAAPDTWLGARRRASITPRLSCA